MTTPNKLLRINQDGRILYSMRFVLIFDYLLFLYLPGMGSFGISVLQEHLAKSIHFIMNKPVFFIDFLLNFLSVKKVTV